MKGTNEGSKTNEENNYVFDYILCHELIKESRFLIDYICTTTKYDIR